MQLRFRSAAARDTDAIALLHARNWQQTYRGMYSDRYLDQEAVSERLAYWRMRFEHPDTNRHVLVCQMGEAVVAFACLLGNHDIRYGSMLDNLHVSETQRGQHIGEALIHRVARWSYQRFPKAPLHLWVLEGNHTARAIYDRLGGEHAETTEGQGPDSSKVIEYLYLWRDITTLIHRTARSDQR